MKKIIAIILMLLTLAMWKVQDTDAVSCFLQYSYVSGLNRICIYDCCGSQAAITIGAVELCPLTINR